MARLVLTRGLPASGKTTWALQQAAKHGAVRANRDDIRFERFNKPFLDAAGEDMVSRLQDEKIAELVASGAQYIIADDTNLNPDVVDRLLRLAKALKLRVEFKDFEAPVGELVRRDAARDRNVTEDIIRMLAGRYCIGEDGKLPRR